MNLNTIKTERRAEIAADALILAVAAGFSVRHVVEIAMNLSASRYTLAELSRVHDQLKD